MSILPLKKNFKTTLVGLITIIVTGAAYIADNVDLINAAISFISGLGFVFAKDANSN